MSYTKTTWTDGSGEPISAANLNKIESGVFNAHTAISGIIDDVTEISDDVSAINSVMSSTVLTKSYAGSSTLSTTFSPFLSIDLEPGVWIVSAHVRSAATASSACTVKANVSATSGSTLVQLVGYTASGQYVALAETVILVVDSAATYYLNVAGTVSVALGQYTKLAAVRIK